MAADACGIHLEVTAECHPTDPASLTALDAALDGERRRPTDMVRGVLAWQFGVHGGDPRDDHPGEAPSGACGEGREDPLHHRCADRPPPAHLRRLGTHPLMATASGLMPSPPRGISSPPGSPRRMKGSAKGTRYSSWEKASPPQAALPWAGPRCSAPATAWR